MRLNLQHLAKRRRLNQQPLLLRLLIAHGVPCWAAWPDLPDHSLGALCESLSLVDAVRSLVPTKSWHDALFDTVASLVLLAHLIEIHELSDLPAGDLANPDTTIWHRKRRF